MAAKIALAGVGNCAAVFLQGLAFYSDHNTKGLWHPTLAGLKPKDLSVVAAFDVDPRKVGLSLSKAVFAPPNVARRYKSPLRTSVRVSAGVSKGDLAPNLRGTRIEKSNPDQIVRVLEDSSADVFVNLVSSGSDASSEEYAGAALRAGCAFVNCTPSLVAKNNRLAAGFVKSRLPLIGDDLMSQFGGTVFHKGLLCLMVRRGIRVSKSYQLDVGGGSETLNTIDETIRMAKRNLKTSSIASEVPYPFETIAGTTDFVDYMGNDRTSYFWLEGSGFMNSGVSVDVYLRSSDGANAGNILLDVLRATYRAMKTGKLGTTNEICAYGFKSPPRPMHFDEALAKFSALYLR
jgi:myo-inositol-1-phosphate synthase